MTDATGISWAAGVKPTRHLSPAELAEREGVPIETVYAWNKDGTGPTRLRIGRHVRYRLVDVERWEESRAR